jgi:histidinol-phosphatase (PHP family)
MPTISRSIAAPTTGHHSTKSKWTRSTGSTGHASGNWLFDFVGHLDLPKKFGFHARADLSRERDAALDAIAAADLAVELNTAGWDKPCAECYPAAALLREVRTREIPVLVSADAHAPEKAAAHYRRAAEALWQIGFRETVRFRQRERIPVPLAID